MDVGRSEPSRLQFFTKLCNEMISISQYQENLKFHLQAEEAHLVTPEIWVAAFFTSVRAQFPVRGKAPCLQEVIVDNIWDQVLLPIFEFKSSLTISKGIFVKCDLTSNIGNNP